MARRRSKNRNNANPFAMMTRIPRQPRYNIRGSLNDQTVLSGNRRIAHTTAAGAGHATVTLDISLARSLDPISDVGILYRQFKYLPGTQYCHVPSVSLTSTGTVSIAFIDNPEQILNWNAFTTEGARFDFISSMGNARTFPIWKEFTYPLVAPPRRLTYDVNSTISATPTADEYERSWQGAFILAFAGVTPADGTISRSFLHQKVMLRGLTGNIVG